jgi:hypothetical protein
MCGCVGLVLQDYISCVLAQTRNGNSVLVGNEIVPSKNMVEKYCFGNYVPTYVSENSFTYFLFCFLWKIKSESFNA